MASYKEPFPEMEPMVKLNQYFIGNAGHPENPLLERRQFLLWVDRESRQLQWCCVLVV